MYAREGGHGGGAEATADDHHLPALSKLQICLGLCQLGCDRHTGLHRASESEIGKERGSE
jgi:hypothetical protein